MDFDVTSISAVVAPAGVLVAVIYYVLDIRNQTKTIKTDLLVRSFSVTLDNDWLESFDLINKSKTADLLKMREEQRMAEINPVVAFYEEVGTLLQMKLIDIDSVERLLHGNAVRTWEKMKLLAEHTRRLRDDPRALEGFEYLYNEMNKKEQKLTTS